MNDDPKIVQATGHAQLFSVPSEPKFEEFNFGYDEIFYWNSELSNDAQYVIGGKMYLFEGVITAVNGDFVKMRTTAPDGRNEFLYLPKLNQNALELEEEQEEVIDYDAHLNHLRTHFDELVDYLIEDKFVKGDLFHFDGLNYEFIRRNDFMVIVNPLDKDLHPVSSWVITES